MKVRDPLELIEIGAQFSYFVDFNLHVQLSRDYKSSSSSQSTSGGGLESDSSDSDRGDGCAGSPRMQRRRKRRNKSQSRTLQAEVHRGQIPAELDVEDLSYVDTLPEVSKVT